MSDQWRGGGGGDAEMSGETAEKEAVARDQGRHCLSRGKGWRKSNGFLSGYDCCIILSSSTCAKNGPCKNHAKWRHRGSRDARKMNSICNSETPIGPLIASDGKY